MRTQAVRALAVVTSVSALASVPAFADVPPPATYVETCTIAKQQQAGSECLTCSAYYGDVNRCTRLLSPYCFTKVCKTWGASAWSEVLCRASRPDASVVPSEIANILGSSMTVGPSSTTADGGMPSTCMSLPSTVTKSATDTQTTTNTQTTSATNSATNTQTTSATNSVTDVETDSKTATKTATKTETQSATVPPSTTDTQSTTRSQSSTTTDAGTTTQSSTVSQTSTSSSTSTQTTSGSTATQTKSPDDSSGCNVGAGTSAYRALGPLTVVLAGLALFLLRRRSRR